MIQPEKIDVLIYTLKQKGIITSEELEQYRFELTKKINGIKDMPIHKFIGKE